MPIVDVEIVGSVSSTVRSSLAQRLADAIGTALGSRPQGTWVKVRYLDKCDYAENGAGHSEGVQPVFVSILLAELPDRIALSHQAMQVAIAVAEACERPREHVHILFEPAAMGRIAFGGQLRE